MRRTVREAWFLAGCFLSVAVIYLCNLWENRNPRRDQEWQRKDGATLH